MKQNIFNETVDVIGHMHRRAGPTTVKLVTWEILRSPNLLMMLREVLRNQSQSGELDAGL